MGGPGSEIDALRRALAQSDQRVAELQEQLATMQVRVDESAADAARLATQLRNLADNDPLTDLVNRDSFERALEAHTAAMVRYGADGALLVIDLDGFGDVQAALGPAAGDDVLVAAADALRHRLRTTDVVGRLGPDEFAALLPRGSTDDARTVAAALVDVVRLTVGTEHVRPGVVTASVGLAVFDGTETPAVALARASGAAEEAKAAGGARWAEALPA